MKIPKSLVFIVASIVLLVLAGCGAKKKVVAQPEEPVVQVPTWHTCLIARAQAEVRTNSQQFSSTITMQVVHDSMLVISVMPLFGMEMFRLEATPTELIAIDKMHGQYAKATYAEVNRRLTPTVNWDVLQQLCSAELPTGDERARLVYSHGDDRIELIVDYTPRRLDGPVKVTNLRVTNYTKVDISKWL